MYAFLFSVAENYAKKNCNQKNHCGSFDQPDLQLLHDYIFQLVDQENKSALKFLSFRCPTLFDETCGSKFKG